MTRQDPQATSGTGDYPPPGGKCGCGHLEGVHLVADRGRGPCGAGVGPAGTRCPCVRYAQGGTFLDAATPPEEPTWKVELCEHCFRPIIWTITPAARAMAVDSEPVLQGGNVALEYRGPDAPPLATVLSVAQQFGSRRNLRTVHQATCPGGRRRSRTAHRA